MQKIISILCYMMFSSVLWASSPCAPLYVACKEAGYYPGGNTVQKGMISHCMVPLVNQQMRLPNVSFDENTLAQCKLQLRDIMSKKA